MTARYTLVCVHVCAEASTCSCAQPTPFRCTLRRRRTLTVFFTSRAVVADLVATPGVASIARAAATVTAAVRRACVSGMCAWHACSIQTAFHFVCVVCSGKGSARFRRGVSVTGADAFKETSDAEIRDRKLASFTHTGIVVKRPVFSSGRAGRVEAMLFELFQHNLSRPPSEPPASVPSLCADTVPGLAAAVCCCPSASECECLTECVPLSHGLMLSWCPPGDQLLMEGEHVILLCQHSVPHACKSRPLCCVTPIVQVLSTEVLYLCCCSSQVLHAAVAYNKASRARRYSAPSRPKARGCLLHRYA